MLLLSRNANLSIYYDDVKQSLYTRWQGELSEQVILEGAQLVLDYQQTRGTAKLLNDNTSITRPWVPGIAWGAKVWLPAMGAAGLQYIAWVYSPHLLSRLVFDQAQSNIGFPITASFDDAVQAVEWLDSQQPGVSSMASRAGQA